MLATTWSIQQPPEPCILKLPAAHDQRGGDDDGSVSWWHEPGVEAPLIPDRIGDASYDAKIVRLLLLFPAQNPSRCPRCDMTRTRISHCLPAVLGEDKKKKRTEVRRPDSTGMWPRKASFRQNCIGATYGMRREAQFAKPTTV